jgi:hypothetical protein
LDYDARDQKPVDRLAVGHEAAIQRSLAIVEELGGLDPADPSPYRKKLLDKLEALDQRLAELHRQMEVRWLQRMGL